jgi:hypothetical protein
MNSKGSPQSASQATTNAPVAVQGGSGGASIGVGATESTISGSAEGVGNLNLGSGSNVGGNQTITITNADAGVVTNALNTTGEIAAESINAQEQSAADAYSALNQGESNFASMLSPLVSGPPIVTEPNGTPATGSVVDLTGGGMFTPGELLIGGLVAIGLLILLLKR